MLTLDANSVERLEVFLKLLQALGASLGWSLARRSILARSLYAGPASRQSRPVGISPGNVPGAFNAWSRTWPDEAQPALEGMTPRLTAQYARGRFLLELRLRGLERRAAANRAHGLGQVDVAALRSVFGMSGAHDQS